MKKKRLAFLTLALPLVLLAGCGGTTAVPVNAYWYKDASTGRNIIGKTERLEYAVTFEASSDKKNTTVSYEAGTYVTELSSVSMTLESGESETVYLYKTVLQIAGNYAYKGEAAPRFEDRVETSVWFRDVSKRLQPIQSEKKIHTTSPNSGASSVKDVCVTYDVSYTLKYSADASSFTVSDYSQSSYTEAMTEPEIVTWEQPKKVSVGSDANYFDNDQLLFVLRGVEMTSKISLVTVNPLSWQKANVAMSENPSKVKETFTFTMNDVAINEEIEAYSVKFGYSGTNPGASQTLVYAKTTDKSNNRFRNVLLRMSTSTLQYLGTLRYNLVKADFND